MHRRAARTLSLFLGLLALFATVGVGSPAAGAEEPLTGSVTDVNGAAVAEVPVVVASEDGSFTEETVTDAQGIFRVETPGPGTYIASIDPEDVPPGVRVPEAAQEGRSITLPSDQILEITLRLTESVQGTLLDQEGDDKAPVEGVSVVVESADGAFTETAVSDPDGKWSVFLPGPGSYRVYVDQESLPDGVSVRSGYKSDLTRQHQRGHATDRPLPDG